MTALLEGLAVKIVALISEEIAKAGGAPIDPLEFSRRVRDEIEARHRAIEADRTAELALMDGGK